LQYCSFQFGSNSEAEAEAEAAFEDKLIVVLNSAPSPSIFLAFEEKIFELKLFRFLRETAKKFLLCLELLIFYFFAAKLINLSCRNTLCTFSPTVVDEKLVDVLVKLGIPVQMKCLDSLSRNI